MSPSDQNRLREHPSERFSDPERSLDLEECYRELLAESHEPTKGHRQISIEHEDSLSLILFHFEPGSELPEHEVQGPVVLQVLSGAMTVTTARDMHELGAGQLLILAPGTPHSVRAHNESRMLATVHLS